jgi:hypothetical protein
MARVSTSPPAPDGTVLTGNLEAVASLVNYERVERA